MIPNTFGYESFGYISLHDANYYHHTRDDNTVYSNFIINAIKIYTYFNYSIIKNPKLNWIVDYKNKLLPECYKDFEGHTTLSDKKLHPAIISFITYNDVDKSNIEESIGIIRLL